MENNETLEKLLEKSARLLSWYECNQTPYFQAYFNKHFSNVRNHGYFVVCSELDNKSIEIYFRAIQNPIYRTQGVKVRNIYK